MAPQKQSRYIEYRKTRKGGRIRKRRYPKTVRGHRHSTTGRILPLLNVRSSNQLHHIKNYLNQGPVAVLIVTADWCGHCQKLKPHIEAAANLPQRNVQIITVRDDMLSGYNKTVNRFNRSASPIEVDGYPSVMLVSRDGKKLTEIAPTEEALMSAMVNVAPVAVEAGIATNRRNSSNNEVRENIAPVAIKTDLDPGNSLISNSKRMMVKPRHGSPEQIIQEVVTNELVSPNQNSLKQPSTSKAISFEHLSNDEIIREEPMVKPMNTSMQMNSVGKSLDVGVSPTIKTFSTNANARHPSNGMITETVPMNAIRTTKRATAGIDNLEAEEITSLQAEPVSPDIRSDTRTPPAVRGGTIIGGGSRRRGGSLYGIMSQTAYRLAPAAVLLATAAAIMKKKTRSNKNVFRRKAKKSGTNKRRH
jgi:thiol-disulfide isomerase/thioredoxin